MNDQADDGPAISKTAFSCPHCGAFAGQSWGRAMSRQAQTGKSPPGEDQFFSPLGTPEVIVGNTIPPQANAFVSNLFFSQCQRCQGTSVWIGERLVYPDTGGVSAPNADMPPEVKAIYFEAASVFQKSPRAAAALLRLAVQLLMVHLGEPGKNINEDIKSLVSKGLAEKLQKALDTLRVIGNESVHPGLIDINDKPEVCLGLFRLINIVVEKTITEQKDIDSLYDVIPDGKKKGIADRDK